MLNFVYLCGYGATALMLTWYHLETSDSRVAHDTILALVVALFWPIVWIAVVLSFVIGGRSSAQALQFRYEDWVVDNFRKIG